MCTALFLPSDPTFIWSQNLLWFGCFLVLLTDFPAPAGFVSVSIIVAITLTYEGGMEVVLSCDSPFSFFLATPKCAKCLWYKGRVSNPEGNESIHFFFIKIPRAISLQVRDYKCCPATPSAGSLQFLKICICHSLLHKTYISSCISQ